MALLKAPVFECAERTARARMVFLSACATMLLVTPFMTVVGLLQVGPPWRAITVVTYVNALGVAVLVANRRGKLRGAAWALVGGLILLASLFSLTAGGMRAQGLVVFLPMALMAGVLLGERSGTITGLLCIGIGLVLVGLDGLGALPPAIVHQTPFSLWVGFSLFMGLVIALQRLATSSVREALVHANVEIAERGRVEEELRRVLAERDRVAEERRRAEAARAALEAQLRQSQKMEALGKLTGGIAHDFNNVLTTISGNTQLALVDLPQGHPARESVLGIEEAGARAVEMVRRMLLFSRQQHGARVAVDLASVVEEGLRLLRPALRRVQLRIVFAPGLPEVSADPTQMHQILMNLVTNATQSMGERGGRLHLVIDAVDVASGDLDLARGRYVRLAVSDTGTGMTPEVLERVFEPFFTTKAPGEGTGLGLSVVHGIVAAHGGAIRARSKPGEGSTFEVYLPALAELTGPAA